MIIVLFLTALVLLYIHYWQRFRLWKRQGIPGPDPVFPFGNVHSSYGKVLHEFDDALMKKYGKVVGFFDGRQPILYVADPAIIKQVTVKNFSSFSANRLFHGHKILSKFMVSTNGPDWKRMRSITSPAFTSGKMKNMMALIDPSFESLTRVLRRYALSHQSVETKNIFQCLSIDVITKTAFATDTQAFDRTDDLVTGSREALVISPLKMMMFNLLPDWMMKAINYTVFSAARIEWLLDFCRAMVTQKKNSTAGAYEDFMDLLLQATHHKDKSKGLTEEEVLANVLLFFIGGYETMSTHLTYASLLLSQHPDAQERLRDEIREAAGGNGLPSFETVMKLPYLDAVAKEVLRIYPPINRVDRIAEEDFTLENGIFVPKGAYIRFPIFNIQHDETLFKNPESFDPDRFIRQEYDVHTFLPFHVGPRNCIGARFAYMVFKHAICHILLNFRLKESDKQTAEDFEFAKTTFFLHVRNVILDVELLEKEKE